jgi:predicted transcriptional regulator
MPILAPALALKDARTRAGLTQRDLARRAETSQSVVARIEAGLTDPSTGTLAKLLAAAGFEIRTELSPIPVTDTHMMDDVARILSLSPEERLEEVGAVARFAWSARRV